MTDSWLILRCSNGKTLDLAASLIEAGFEAWAPVETAWLRPRRGLKAQEVTLPLMPGFVFSRADRLPDLLALSHNPVLTFQVWDRDQRRMVTKGHPYFRVFRPFGEIRTVSDRQLTHLRSLEKKRRPKSSVPVFDPGARVRFDEGGFEGLSGVVERTLGSYVLVTIDDWSIPVQVSPWLLRVVVDETSPVHVNTRATEQASSAKAA